VAPDLDDALLELFEAEVARRADRPDLRGWIERSAPQHCPIPWHLGQLIDLFARAIERPTLALVSMPPRHAKTTTVRRALAYTIVTEPERLNAFVTYAADYAYTHSRAIRKLVQKSGGRIADDAANVKDWRTPEEGGLSATGIGGQLTGKGFDGLLVVDDPFKNREEAESPVVREKVWNGFNDDIYTRREPRGSIIVVATRWHDQDLNGRLEEETDEDGRPTWEVINLPAIRDPHTGEAADSGVALWPERYPLEALVRIRRKLGPYGWWSLFQGKPRPRDGKVFKVPARWTTLPEGGRVIVAVDPAGSANTRANHTVAVALWVTGSGSEMRAWLVGLLRMQREPAAAAAALEVFQRRWGATLHIEGSRDGLAQAKSLHDINDNLAITIVPAIGDKFTRAQALAAAWNGAPERGESPRFFVPAEPALIGCTQDDLGNYLRVMEKFTGVGDAEDDDVDASAHGWNIALALAGDDEPAAPREPPPLPPQHDRSASFFASR
jgi:hypothetical protein